MKAGGATYKRWFVLLIAMVCCRGLHAQIADTLETTMQRTDSIETVMSKSAPAENAIEAPLDTTIVDSLLNRLTTKRDRAQFTPDPIRSLWLALVFPGGGQIYNRKLWKLPIVYGGFLGCTYALTWNNQMLRDYSQAYLDIMDDNPDTKSYEDMLPLGYSIEGKEERFKTIFKNKKDHFRRYRDLSIFAFAGVYLISVIDAYVDAELSSFDISRDLSIHFEPAVINTGLPVQSHLRQNAYGLSMCVKY